MASILSRPQCVYIVLWRTCRSCVFFFLLFGMLIHVNTVQMSLQWLLPCYIFQRIVYIAKMAPSPKINLVSFGNSLHCPKFHFLNSTLKRMRSSRHVDGGIVPLIVRLCGPAKMAVIVWQLQYFSFNSTESIPTCPFDNNQVLVQMIKDRVILIVVGGMVSMFVTMFVRTI